MKVFKFAFLSFLMCMLICGYVYGAESEIKVIVNGQTVQSDRKPVIIEETTFVPLRPAAEAMGCIVEWYDDLKTANISMGDKLIALQIGNKKISKYEMQITEGEYKYNTYKVPVFSEEIVCDMPPRIIDNSTYIPLRAMAEALDADVEWNAETKTVFIITNGGDTIENNVVYKIEDDTLIISGTGKIEDNFGLLSEKDNYQPLNTKSLVIEEGITDIGELCFTGADFESVSLPNSLTSIGGSAFSCCFNLTSITIPGKVKSIADDTFSGCHNLNKVFIQGNITDIGMFAFSGCTSLTTIILPDSLTKIGSSAFKGCTGLTTITLPDSLTSIDESAFSGCTGLTEITVPDNVTNIGNSAFSGCSSLKEATLPNSLINLGSCAFYECTDLKKIVIPDTVIEYGAGIFFNCTDLESVVLSKNAPVITEYMFSSCSSLKEAVLPPCVESVEGFAFYMCSGLESISIPKQTVFNGSNNFLGCTNIETVLCYKNSPADNSKLYHNSDVTFVYQ